MRKIYLWTSLISLIFSSSFIDFALADGGQAHECGSWRSMMPMMGVNSMISGGMTGFGLIFMILFWILVIFAIVVLVKWIIDQTQKSTASETLRQRYAEEKISKKEFQKKKDTLNNQ